MREILEASLNEKKSVLVYLKGQSIGGVVVKLGRRHGGTAESRIHADRRAHRRDRCRGDELSAHRGVVFSRIAATGSAADLSGHYVARISAKWRLG